jgi:hypothetical protein
LGITDTKHVVYSVLRASGWITDWLLLIAFARDIEIYMTALNPYEPSGIVSDAQADCTIASKRVGSFFIIHCLTFVTTFMVVGIAISCYRAGVGTVLRSPFRATPFGLAIILWLPHAFFALLSNKIRCAGARLSGVVAATFLVFGTYAMEWILRNWLTSFSLSGFLFLALGLLISLAAVALLGHCQARSEATKRSRVKFFEN